MAASSSSGFYTDPSADQNYVDLRTRYADVPDEVTFDPRIVPRQHPHLDPASKLSCTYTQFFYDLLGLLLLGENRLIMLHDLPTPSRNSHLTFIASALAVQINVSGDSSSLEAAEFYALCWQGQLEVAQTARTGEHELTPSQLVLLRMLPFIVQPGRAFADHAMEPLVYQQQMRKVMDALPIMLGELRYSYAPVILPLLPAQQFYDLAQFEAMLSPAVRVQLAKVATFMLRATCSRTQRNTVNYRGLNVSAPPAESIHKDIPAAFVKHVCHLRNDVVINHKLRAYLERRMLGGQRAVMYAQKETARAHPTFSDLCLSQLSPEPQVPCDESLPLQYKSRMADCELTYGTLVCFCQQWIIAFFCSKYPLTETELSTEVLSACYAVESQLRWVRILAALRRALVTLVQSRVAVKIKALKVALDAFEAHFEACGDMTDARHPCPAGVRRHIDRCVWQTFSGKPAGSAAGGNGRSPFAELQVPALVPPVYAGASLKRPLLHSVEFLQLVGQEGAPPGRPFCEDDAHSFDNHAFVLAHRRAIPDTCYFRLAIDWSEGCVSEEVRRNNQHFVDVRTALVELDKTNQSWDKHDDLLNLSQEDALVEDLDGDVSELQQLVSFHNNRALMNLVVGCFRDGHETASAMDYIANLDAPRAREIMEEVRQLGYLGINLHERSGQLFLLSVIIDYTPQLLAVLESSGRGNDALDRLMKVVASGSYAAVQERRGRKEVQLHLIGGHYYSGPRTRMNPDRFIPAHIALQMSVADTCRLYPTVESTLVYYADLRASLRNPTQLRPLARNVTVDTRFIVDDQVLLPDVALAIDPGCFGDLQVLPENWPILLQDRAPVVPRSRSLPVTVEFFRSQIPAWLPVQQLGYQHQGVVIRVPADLDARLLGDGNVRPTLATDPFHNVAFLIYPSPETPLEPTNAKAERIHSDSAIACVTAHWQNILRWFDVIGRPGPAERGYVHPNHGGKLAEFFQHRQDLFREFSWSTGFTSTPALVNNSTCSLKDFRAPDGSYYPHCHPLPWLNSEVLRENLAINDDSPLNLVCAFILREWSPNFCVVHAPTEPLAHKDALAIQPLLEHPQLCGAVRPHSHVFQFTGYENQPLVPGARRLPTMDNILMVAMAQRIGTLVTLLKQGGHFGVADAATKVASKRIPALATKAFVHEALVKTREASRPLAFHIKRASIPPGYDFDLHLRRIREYVFPQDHVFSGAESDTIHQFLAQCQKRHDNVVMAAAGGRSGLKHADSVDFLLANAYALGGILDMMYSLGMSRSARVAVYHPLLSSDEDVEWIVQFPDYELPAEEQSQLGVFLAAITWAPFTRVVLIRESRLEHLDPVYPLRIPDSSPYMFVVRAFYASVNIIPLNAFALPVSEQNAVAASALRPIDDVSVAEWYQNPVPPHLAKDMHMLACLINSSHKVPTTYIASISHSTFESTEAFRGFLSHKGIYDMDHEAFITGLQNVTPCGEPGAVHTEGMLVCGCVVNAVEDVLHCRQHVGTLLSMIRFPELDLFRVKAIFSALVRSGLYKVPNDLANIAAAVAKTFVGTVIPKGPTRDPDAEDPNAEPEITPTNETEQQANDRRHREAVRAARLLRSQNPIHHPAEYMRSWDKKNSVLELKNDETLKYFTLFTVMRIARAHSPERFTEWRDSVISGAIQAAGQKSSASFATVQVAAFSLQLDHCAVSVGGVLVHHYFKQTHWTPIIPKDFTLGRLAQKTIAPLFDRIYREQLADYNRVHAELDEYKAAKAANPQLPRPADLPTEAALLALKKHVIKWERACDEFNTVNRKGAWEKQLLKALEFSDFRAAENNDCGIIATNNRIIKSYPDLVVGQKVMAFYGTLKVYKVDIMDGLPEMWITSTTGYDYVEAGWESLQVLEIHRWMDQMFTSYGTTGLEQDRSRELTTFVARDMARGLYGSNMEKKIRVYWGALGDNAKSTFIKFIQRVYGTYAEVCQANIFTDHINSGSASPQLAKLAHLRWAFCGELDHNDEFSGSLLKKITSNDEFEARKLFEGPMVVRPVTRFGIHSNEKPVIRSGGPVALRRFIIIPCLATYTRCSSVIVKSINDRRRDKTYVADESFELKIPALRPAMLWIFVQIYPGKEFAEVAATESEKKTYLAEMNNYSRFKAARLIVKPHTNGEVHILTRDEMYEMYQAYCKQMNERCSSLEEFVRGMQATGLPCLNDLFRNVALRPPTSEVEALEQEIRLRFPEQFPTAIPVNVTTVPVAYQQTFSRLTSRGEARRAAAEIAQLPGAGGAAGAAGSNQRAHNNNHNQNQ